MSNEKLCMRDLNQKKINESLCCSVLELEVRGFSHTGHTEVFVMYKFVIDCQIQIWPYSVLYCT